MTDRSREPISENCSVRGIGVAVIVSVSTSALNWRSFSLAATPNFCSSSIISNPRSLNPTFLPRILCVPIRMSIRPSATSFNIWLTSAVLFARLRCSMRTGNSLSRSLKVR